MIILFLNVALVLVNYFTNDQSYITKFSLSVCVCMSVRSRLPNHAYYGDEAFTGHSMGLG